MITRISIILFLFLLFLPSLFKHKKKEHADPFLDEIYEESEKQVYPSFRFKNFRKNKSRKTWISWRSSVLCNIRKEPNVQTISSFTLMIKFFIKIELFTTLYLNLFRALPFLSLSHLWRKLCSVMLEKKHDRLCQWVQLFLVLCLLQPIKWSLWISLNQK